MKSSRALKNLKIAEDLFNIAYKTKTYQIQKKHPEWPQKQIHEKVMELISKGCE